MLFWIILAALGLGAGLWMALPFLKNRSLELSGAEGAISIYRDQLDEVERDRAAGLISEAESVAATREIERRALHAARNLDTGLARSSRAPGTALTVTALAAVAVTGGYALLGEPGRADQPLAQRQADVLAAQAEAGDLSAKIAQLVQRTKDNPDSFEDWWLLARTYVAVGDDASAADAYRHAAELSNNDPRVLSAYAEAMTLANGNKVPGAARLIFEQIAAERDDPRAKYYVGLALAQDQNFEGALAVWSELAFESQPGAPWMPLVRRDITNMARILKLDVTEYLPNASPEEVLASGGGLLPGGAGAAPVSDRDALIAALEADPKDYKGWIALAESYAVAGEDDKAVEAITMGKRHYAAAPFVLQKFQEAERALGLDLLAAPAGVAGPSAEDVATITALPQDEQADMIEGMVAGLAAKLEENPNNPDGWVMLVRSYSTLGRVDKAQASYEKALKLFEADPVVLAQIKEQAGGLVGN